MQNEDNPFVLWNQRLLDARFSASSTGEEVILQVSPADLDSIGSDLGGDQGFLRAVRSGPPWSAVDCNARYPRLGVERDFSERTLGLMIQRRKHGIRPAGYVDPGDLSDDYRGASAPTYLPMLAALVRTQAVCGSSFYDNLRTALGLPDSWGSQNLKELNQVWDDLDRWTHETDGYFGFFKARRLGGYTQLGALKSQTIVSNRDIEAIGRIFRACRLRPGQKLSSEALVELKAEISGASFLSAAFKQAAVKPEYAEIIEARIKILFDDWDGSVSVSESEQCSEDKTSRRSPKEVAVCLSLGDSNAGPWHIHFAMPLECDDDNFMLEQGSGQWALRRSGPDFLTSGHIFDDHLDRVACSILDNSRRGDEFFKRESIDFESGVVLASKQVVFKKQSARIMVWTLNESTGGSHLQEHSLPSHGVAFVLVAPDLGAVMSDFLSSSRVEFNNWAHLGGLPPDWAVYSISNCEKFTEEERLSFPGVGDNGVAQKQLKFIGGSNVGRGGVKQFLSYDLPILEADGPLGAEIIGLGIELEEIRPARDVLWHQFCGIRRFRLDLGESTAKNFVVQMVDHGTIISTIKLRVSSDSGEHTSAQEGLMLGRLGEVLRGAPVGMRGIVVSPSLAEVAHNWDADKTPIAARFKITAGELGGSIGFDQAKEVQSLVASRFLDLLAQKGALVFSRAQDFLLRQFDVTRSSLPMQIIFALRERGCLELEVNSKGHLVRVHAVEPAFVELPIECHGRKVFGFLGTLRLAQWELLAAPPSGLQAFGMAMKDDGCSVPCFRFLESASGALRSFAKDLGFQIHATPACQLADWSLSAGDVTAAASESAVESLSASGEVELHRLNPQTAKFFLVDGPGAGAVPENYLFRTPDLQTGRHKNYVLGFRKEGRWRFAAMRDSRWGVWIALNSFLRFLRENYGIDCGKWPLPYDPDTGSVLLPARIHLPVILERALVLCSGENPTKEIVSGESKPGLGVVLKSKADDSAVLGLVSQCYEEMSSGLWLRFRWIPREVAQMVANKLGAELAVFK